LLHTRSSAFLRLCATGFLAYTSYAICRAPLLPLLARELGATPAIVGVVMASSTVTGVFLKLPAGVWSDVLGRKPLLLAATVVFAVMPFSYLAIGSLVVLMAARFIHGSATAIMGPVMSATISDIAPPERRATWLSTYSTVQGMGQAIAPVIAGLLIARGRYDIAFIIAGAIAITTPLILSRLEGKQAQSNHSAHLPQQFRQGVIEVIRERRILVASVTHAAYFVMNGTLNAFLPLFAQDALGLTASEIGFLFGMQMVTTLAIRPLIGMASDRLGRRGAIAVGLAACAVSVWAISMSTSKVDLTAAVLLYAAGVAITTAATSAYITDVAPKARFGAAHGVFGTIYDIGDAAGPLAGGLLVTAYGYTVTFQLMAAMALIVTISFLWLSRAASGSFQQTIHPRNPPPSPS
jgi:MFS transporter, DHA1 family, multidrug resistance protein